MLQNNVRAATSSFVRSDYLVLLNAKIVKTNGLRLHKFGPLYTVIDIVDYRILGIRILLVTLASSNKGE